MDIVACLNAEGKIAQQQQDGGPRLEPEEKDIDVLQASSKSRFAAADARLASAKAALKKKGVA